MTDDGMIAENGEMVALTPQERLTEQFYVWEIRGRGWQLWNEPVALEPPFRPFLGHFLPSPPPRDDARKPTFLSKFAESFTGKSTHGPLPPADPYPADENEIEPEPFAPESQLVELEIVLPQKTSVGKESTEQFLVGLCHARQPLSFEVVGLPDSIRVQLACREGDLAQLRNLLAAYFPEAVVNERKSFLESKLNGTKDTETVTVDFGLSDEFMAPLRSFRNFDVDPLIGIAGVLQDLRENECAVLQVLFQAARCPWAESIMRAVTDWEGKSFFGDSPEMVAQAEQKVSRPLFAAVVRVAAQSPDGERAWELARSLGSALAQFADPVSNEFIPLSNDEYPDVFHIEDILERRSRRSGMILNADELVSLVHLPSSSVRLEKLAREEKRTKAAPQLAVGHALVLGENTHAGKTVQVSLSPEQRIKHTYVIGASGTGKSTLLLNMIIQDIRNGEGIGVLDPHGDLIDQVLEYIRESRFDDVVLLDPADEEYPVGFNILSAHSELEKTLLSSDLVDVFRRLSTSWGDQMTSVLGNAILAFLESDRGGTLADLRRFLVEAEYRREFLGTVRDPEVVYYWQKEFPLLSGKPQGPILTRLDTFLRPKLIRHMIAQKENRLDFRSIMDGKKIFLAKLAQGAIGEENAYLLGSFIVSKLHQVAMARQEVKESERQNFYLYIDEFHNFITPSMASILAGARKYHLGLILAHQELRQMWNRDTDVTSAVISNPYTRICFRLGDFDAQKLKDGFSFYEAKDLQNLGIGEAIARIERAEFDFNLKTLPLPVADQGSAEMRREKLVALSRQKYARHRAEIESELAKERPRIEVPVPTPQPA
jgi:hypothetical protein